MEKNTNSEKERNADSTIADLSNISPKNKERGVESTISAIPNQEKNKVRENLKNTPREEPVTEGRQKTVKEIDTNSVEREISKKYELIKKIGKGGMAEVQEAITIQDIEVPKKTRNGKIVNKIVKKGTRVAIKILTPNPRSARDEEDKKKFKERFHQEAWTVHTLPDHPNIVSVLEVNLDYEYMVMQHISGEDLEDLIIDKKLSLKEILTVIKKAAWALKHVHDHGIIHRDIKPANILASGDGDLINAYVTDFGICKLIDPDRIKKLVEEFKQQLANEKFVKKILKLQKTNPKFLDENPILKAAQFDVVQTKPGSMVGTIHFICPEQLTGGLNTPKIDQHSLGATLYFCLTGVPPYIGYDTKAICHNILNEDPPGITIETIKDQFGIEISKNTEKAINQLLHTLMDKKPSQRYKDMEKVEEAITNIKKTLQ